MSIEKIGQNLFQIKSGFCRTRDGSGSLRFTHQPIIISEDLATVECGTCKEKLDPTQVLISYARHESQLSYRYNTLKIEIEKLKFQQERQNRVRCEHCQKLTRIKKGDA